VGEQRQVVQLHLEHSEIKACWVRRAREQRQGARLRLECKSGAWATKAYGREQRRWARLRLELSMSQVILRPSTEGTETGGRGCAWNITANKAGLQAIEGTETVVRLRLEPCGAETI